MRRLMTQLSCTPCAFLSPFPSPTYTSFNVINRRSWKIPLPAKVTQNARSSPQTPNLCRSRRPRNPTTYYQESTDLTTTTTIAAYQGQVWRWLRILGSSRSDSRYIETEFLLRSIRYNRYEYTATPPPTTHSVDRTSFDLTPPPKKKPPLTH